MITEMAKKMEMEKAWGMSLEVTNKSLPGEVIKHPETKAAHALKSTMGQTWQHNSNNQTWSDQYGYVIQKQPHQARPFQLEKGGVVLCAVYRLNTAKLISTILINDGILGLVRLDANGNEIL